MYPAILRQSILSKLSLSQSILSKLFLSHSILCQLILFKLFLSQAIIHQSYQTSINQSIYSAKLPKLIFQVLKAYGATITLLTALLHKLKKDLWDSRQSIKQTNLISRIVKFSKKLNTTKERHHSGRGCFVDML